VATQEDSKKRCKARIRMYVFEITERLVQDVNKLLSSHINVILKFLSICKKVSNYYVL